MTTNYIIKAYDNLVGTTSTALITRDDTNKIKTAW